MGSSQAVIAFRVRYSETDQMGTFYNSRVLEWFECGRTEFLRGCGLPYREMERRGVFLPVVESYAKYQGRAQYDDLLHMTCSATLVGKARVRFEMVIVHAESGAPVAQGYTVHAFTDDRGKPGRAPEWFADVVNNSKKVEKRTRYDNR